ncbi:DNA methyltransferase [Arthrobacter phage Anjali]|uniref:DNA methyltransferase n=1 Tax=Arthrobacter phage Anjali TaxID=2484217 RepID=A0A3G3LXT5_9CAUD|nr:DNA methyltransferase [Arthrobacter phage Anjali]AYQ98972.1 DNA methyltransferase [Arthrobacter phage Anjali]
MKVLVACEYSGRVRDAFLSQGHDAISCDLLPTDAPGPHYQGDVFDIINDGFDLMVAHPPCTYLTNSGVRWLHERPERWELMREGAKFFSELLNADIPRIAVENPVMHGYARELIGSRATQTIQPWMFGHAENKRTGLWLKNLPPLEPTRDARPIMEAMTYAEKNRVHYASPGKDRWKQRSTTYAGVARAMGRQWGVT